MRLLSLKSILVAVDLDDTSIPALRTAADLASLTDAELHLLHVRPEPDSDREPRLQRHFQEAAGDRRIPDSIEEIIGLAAPVIVQQALKVSADAIVLGPHRKGRSDAALGSTAAAVVNTASCPCLVLATELRLPLRTVMAPVDVSNAMGGSLSVALTWASALRPRSADVTLAALHVTNAAPDSAQQRLHEEVQHARSRAGGADHVDIRELVMPGSDPAAEILRAVSAEHTDLLVVGTRGAARGKEAMGSVSVALTRAAPCPLLLVPPAIWQEQA
jgi:nucleotide-binding universal stress UspA family protein